MSINTNLKGRLRNTNLPKSNSLLPLFEAIINSIHSIDERKNIDKIDITKTYIKINIVRSNQLKFEDKPEITGFKIIDNGIGFNDENFNSFQTLDSEYKIKIGGRGIGRLLWLKVFNNVSIQSCFQTNKRKQLRLFDFSITNNIHNEELRNVSDEQAIETTIKLLNIKEKYIKHIPKTAYTIANEILEHCLWYFLREGGAPKIIIEDFNERILLDDLYDSYMLNSSDSDIFNLKSHEFHITHVKLKSTAYLHHSIIYSAANRVVKEENLLGKIPGLFGVLNDGENDFRYMCFVTSQFLTDEVKPERIDFNISESVDDLFQDEEISFKEIRNEIIKIVKKYLENFLEENKKIGLQKVNNFVNQKAPRYKPILKRIPDDDKIVEPSISDKDLEIKLHKYLMNIESELIAEGHDLMLPNNIENVDEYSNRLEEYLTKASDLKKSDLANYVAHRKVILDILSKTIEIQKDGKYPREDIIHKLIMPMQIDDSGLTFNDTNLWLIDERLAFHNYLASDKTLKSMPITDATVTKEPDILALNVFDNPILVNDGQKLPLATITVIEIKRPMRNDAKPGEDKDPIEQALGYLNKIRKGAVKTESGRQIPNSESIPGFCYVLSDITQSIKSRCEMLDLQITRDKLGYFGYHQTYNAYIEVISFDRLLNSSKERNRAFFDRLGLPTT